MVELAQRIMRSGDPAPLLERGTQLDALTRAFDAARGGAGATVLVAGEAGIGKTTLVEYFSAQSLAPRILWGDAPAPDAIVRAAERNCPPVPRITEVRVLNPYFYR